MTAAGAEQQGRVSGRRVSAAPPAHACVEITGVSKTYAAKDGAVVALKDVSLQLAAGEFVSVIGPSGCGKSTLLRIAAGLTRADSGRVTIDAGTLAAAQRHKKIGLVGQTPALLPWRTVLDNVTLPLRVNRAGREQPDARVAAELLRDFGLGDRLRAYPRELSGGMQQRVAIARAFVFNPTVLLMDEPFSALDEITRERQRLALLRFWRTRRTSVLFVTHSVAEAIVLADRLVVMSTHPGRVAATVEITLPRPRDERTYTTARYRALEASVRANLRAQTDALDIDAR